MSAPQRVVHNVPTNNLADVLERVLDKGVVIAGDIKIKLVDVELLTIQLRLLVTSVDKAKEMGIDFWTREPAFSSRAADEKRDQELAAMRRKIEQLEAARGEPAPAQAQ